MNFLNACGFLFSEVVIFRPSHLRSKLEPSTEVFKGVADTFYIKKFIEASIHGLVGHITPENNDQFKKPLCIVYYKVDFERNAKGKVLVAYATMNMQELTSKT